MKKILFIAVSFFFVASFMSCQKDKTTEGISRLTYFPVFDIQGSTNISINVGDNYVDPGVVVTENGTPIDYTTSVSSVFFGYKGTAVDPNIADVYQVIYSAVNKDGYTASAARTVTVNPANGDFVNSLEGWYTADVNRSAPPSYTGLQYIMVSKLGPNKYGISDGIGGYYAIGRGYGNGYLGLGATFTADIANGVYTPGPAYTVGSFGGTVVMTNLAVDAATKTISFVATWDSGYTFTVTLKQVQL